MTPVGVKCRHPECAAYWAEKRGETVSRDPFHHNAESGPEVDCVTGQKGPHEVLTASVDVSGWPRVTDVRVRSSSRGHWRSNVAWPNMVSLTLPNGDACDLACFSRNEDNPWPLDEEVPATLHYTGLVPMGFPLGSVFTLRVVLLGVPR